MMQAYARLQQLRGAAVAVPAGAAASMDQTSKVLASIEMLAGAPTPEGAAAVAKMEQVWAGDGVSLQVAAAKLPDLLPW